MCITAGFSTIRLMRNNHSACGKNVKGFTLRNGLVKSYRKTHPRKPVSLSIYLVACNNRNFARILVQTENYKKAASKF